MRTSHTASLIPQFVLIGKRHKLQSPEAIKLKMLPLPRLAMARKRLQQWRRLIKLLSTSHRGILNSGHRTVEQTSIGIAMQWAMPMESRRAVTMGSDDMRGEQLEGSG
jgi:hypothetical protein